MAEEVERTIQIEIKITGTSTVNDSILIMALNDSRFKERVRGLVFKEYPVHGGGGCEVGPVNIGPKGGYTRILRVSGG